MTSQIAIVLALLFIALLLFGTERIPIDIVSFLLVIALVITQTLSVSEAFAGFGNDIVITVAGLFVLTGGLAKTGVVDLVGRRLHRFAGDNEFRITALIMFAAALSAAVMKNTTTTAMFLPVVLGIGRTLKRLDFRRRYQLVVLVIVFSHLRPSARPYLPRSGRVFWSAFLLGCSKVG